MTAPATTRIGALDQLRGFALAGIVLVNALFLMGVVGMDGTGPASPISSALDVLVQGRFYPIFALLFGVGMTVFLTNAHRRGDRPYRRMLRRLGVLAVLGAGHMVINQGDVLLMYAIVGALVLVAHRFPQRVLVPLAVLAIVPGAYFGGGELVLPGLFMLGMAAGRTDALTDPERFRAAYTGGVVACGAAGVALMLAVPAARESSLAEPFAGAVGVIMAASYVCAMMLFLPTASGQRLGRTLAPFGRMALTNYISQTVIMVLLHATVMDGANTPLIALVTAVAIVAVQIPLSRWWLTRHRQGPLEAAWRRLTYGRSGSRHTPAVASVAVHAM
jgi:uncharacterized protein